MMNVSTKRGKEGGICSSCHKTPANSARKSPWQLHHTLLLTVVGDARHLFPYIHIPPPPFPLFMTVWCFYREPRCRSPSAPWRANPLFQIYSFYRRTFFNRAFGPCVFCTQCDVEIQGWVGWLAKNKCIIHTYVGGNSGWGSEDFDEFLLPLLIIQYRVVV